MLESLVVVCMIVLFMPAAPLSRPKPSHPPSIASVVPALRRQVARLSVGTPRQPNRREGRMSPSSRQIGVTGGIGAGKTAVLQLLGEIGCRTVDADDVVHWLYEPGHPGYEIVSRRWGKRVLTAGGEVDRKAVAEIVFRERSELQWLNGVIHPRVRERIRSLASESETPLFCGVPLLFETGWDRFMWRSVSVWCPFRVQWQRLRHRGWDQEEIERRLACQMNMDEKLARGDFGIINNSSWRQLREQCRLLVERLEHAA